MKGQHTLCRLCRLDPALTKANTLDITLANGLEDGPTRAHILPVRCLLTQASIAPAAVMSLAQIEDISRVFLTYKTSPYSGITQ